MKVAVFGATGQLGSAICLQLGDRAVPITGASELFREPERMKQLFVEAAPTHVLNAAAYNFVDQAEEDPSAAFQGNSVGPRNLAFVCRELSIPLMHVSTDYVFGLETTRKTPYSESDSPGPVSVYGTSKLSGEYLVQAGWERSFVVRTCGLYGNPPSTGKGNFVRTMLRLGRERGHVRVVDDQWCTPTSVFDLAPALISLFETDRYGLYHATNSGATTWCQLTKVIFEAARINATVEAIPTSEYPTKARRPTYSVLDTGKLSQVLGEGLPPWEEAVAGYVTALS